MAEKTEKNEKKTVCVRDLIKKFNKEYQDNNLMIFSDIKPNYRRLVTNAFGLDYILGGGFIYGRTYEVSGLFHSGKTGFCMLAISAYQRENPTQTCVYVDAEHSLDLKFWARMTGVDLSRLLYVNLNSQSGQQVLDMIIELQKTADIGMIILDSLPALIPQAVMENDLTKDNGMRGTMAKPLYPFYAMMAEMVANKDNIFIAVNQVRDAGKTAQGIQLYKEPCGMAPSFYSSIILRFGTRKWTLGDDMDACKSNNGEGADGFRLQFKIMKNKCGSCARGGGFLTFRYATGFDWLNDLLEIALTFGFIEKINNQTYRLINLETNQPYYDENGKELKGYKKDLIAYIKTNYKFQNEYLAMLNRFISKDDSETYGKLLDAREIANIDAQQEAVDTQYTSQDRQDLTNNTVEGE